jgi:hypothetical protein
MSKLCFALCRRPVRYPHWWPPACSASPIPSIVFLHPVCDIVNRSSAKDRFCFTKWIVSQKAAHFHRVIRHREHSKPQYHVDSVALPQVPKCMEQSSQLLLGTGSVRKCNDGCFRKPMHLPGGICRRHMVEPRACSYLWVIRRSVVV